MASYPVYHAHLLLNPPYTGYLRLGHATNGKLGTGKLAGDVLDADWTSVQTRLYAFETTHGRDDAGSGVAAGTLSMQLDDDDGALDPEHTGSGYYPYVRLNKRGRAQAVWNSVTYTLGYGFADAYEPSPTALGASVRVGFTDLFKRLARRTLTRTFPAQRTDVRIGAVLDELDWPYLKRSLTAGYLILPGKTLDGVSALQHLDQIIQAERGNFFIRGDGTAVFHSRYYRQTVTSSGTFGAGTALPVVLVEGAYTEEGLANEVSIRLQDSTSYVVSDAASQREHGNVPYTVSDDVAEQLGEDGARKSFAQAILTAQEQPVSRIRAIGLDAQANRTTLWPHILGREVGDRITVTHTLPGTKGLTATDFFIERVSHAWSISEQGQIHTCTWGVSKAPTGAAANYWRLGHATYGKLGTGTLAW